jgi:hypothetical protein
MKVDSVEIDKFALSSILQDAYGLHPESLVFLPYGEESYCYKLETAAKQSYLVKVQELSPDMDIRYHAVYVLHTLCDLKFVVHPYITLQNKVLVNFGKYTVAVFNFVDDAVSLMQEADRDDLKNAAALTAALHNSINCPMLPSLPVEAFDLWFEDWLVKVITAVEEPLLFDDETTRKAQQLLYQEKTDILTTLTQLKQLAANIKSTPIDLVLTHGDLNRGNFIKDRMGDLHLVDWSKIAVGPPERDLVNFIGEDLELFISVYLQSFDKLPILLPELFEFYHLYLILWAIADYGSWILLEDADIKEKKFVWEQLQQLVPIDHDIVKVDEIYDLIERVR